MRRILWHVNAEPRSTIVCAWLDAWKGRNEYRRREGKADSETSARYWRGERLSCQDTLYVLQRIRKVVKEA